MSSELSEQEGVVREETSDTGDGVRTRHETSKVPNLPRVLYCLFLTAFYSWSVANNSQIVCNEGDKTLAFIFPYGGV
jgi:hypothetical protein